MPSTETAMRHPQTLATLPMPPSDTPNAGIAPEDWDLMLDAVTARLRTHSTSQQAVMLECAAALEQLHAALRHERAKASAELAGIRDGEQRARRIARHDGLTGLPNRNDFHEQLDRLLAERSGGCQTIGVLYLDLDGFKHCAGCRACKAGSSSLSGPASAWPSARTMRPPPSCCCGVPTPRCTAPNASSAATSSLTASTPATEASPAPALRAPVAGRRR